MTKLIMSWLCSAYPRFLENGCLDFVSSCYFWRVQGKKHDSLFFFLRSRSRRSSRRHYTRSRSRSRSHRRSRSRSYSRDYRRRHSHSHSPMSTRRRHIGNRVCTLQRRGGGVNRLEYILKSLRSFRRVFHKIILLPARVYLKGIGEVNCHLFFLVNLGFP